MYHISMNDYNAKPLQTIESSTWYLVRRTSREYLKPYVGKLVTAILFMAFSAAMTAAFAKLIEPLLDKVFVNKQAELVVPMAIAILVVFILNGLATYIHTVLMNNIGQSVVSNIQRDLFTSLINQDLGFFHGHSSGQLVSRMINDVNAMRVSVADTMTAAGKNFLTLVFLIIVMFMQDFTLALIAFFVFPPAVLFITYLGLKIRKVSRNIQGSVANLTSLLSQVFQGVRQVKAYGMETQERDRVYHTIQKINKLIFKSVRTGNLSTPINETMLGIAFMGVIMYGGFSIVDGTLTPGKLMSFISAFSLAYEPLKRMAKTNNNLQAGLGAAERVYAMMDARPSIVDKPGAIELDTRKPTITYENIVFRYDGADGVALENVSFTAAAGKVAALIGPSGSGKTTALNLVPRFYDVMEGRLLIDGHDIRDLSMESLRRHIALVSQDITIFDDTVRANIAYGKINATDEEIEKAAQYAAADVFINAMPEGYNTQLGENGVKLSGGQRQRIAIARAMLRDAPILLLDEATSALDNESERAIQASLERLQQGRTTIVIAHRLSTVQRADLIVAMDKGRVVETGTHDELIAHEGLYARMHRSGLEE